MNCKPGDLAILIRCPWPENVGAIVEVLEVNTRLTAEFGQQIWRVRATGRRLRARDHNSSALKTFYGDNLNATDGQLRPITGLPIDEDVTEDLKEPAL